MKSWWIFQWSLFPSSSILHSALRNPVCRGKVILIWTLREIWICKYDSLGLVFLVAFCSYLSHPWSLLSFISIAVGQLASQLNKDGVMVGSNSWPGHSKAWWQTNTGQLLNVFTCFCSVVGAKCGGGKKTCVLWLYIFRTRWTAGIHSLNCVFVWQQWKHKLCRGNSVYMSIYLYCGHMCVWQCSFNNV